MKGIKSFSIAIFALLILTSVASAQVSRADLDLEFAGMPSQLTYGTGTGLKVINMKNRLSRFKRGMKCKKITSNANALISQIPTVDLAAEHWWLSFEMQMICQRDYAVCVDDLEDLQKDMGITCMISDPSCSSAAETILRVRDYWVPFNIQNATNGKVAREGEYKDQFKAGIDSVDLTYEHLQACLATVTYYEGL